MPVAAAVVGSTLVGAYSANKAAQTQADAAKKGLAQSNILQQSAITQAKDYFNIGQKSAQAGYQSALDLFKASQPAKYQPMIQGNVAAQRMVGLGATQANNAILGLPVDMSFANQPQALQPDYSAVQNAQLPMLGGQQIAQNQPTAQQIQQQTAAQGNMTEAQSRDYYNNLARTK